MKIPDRMALESNNAFQGLLNFRRLPMDKEIDRMKLAYWADVIRESKETMINSSFP